MLLLYVFCFIMLLYAFLYLFFGVCSGFLLLYCALMCLLLFLFKIIAHKLAKTGSFSYYCVVIDISLGLEPPAMENY